MADKIYRLIFEKDDGTEESIEFTAPQGPAGANGEDGNGIKSAVLNDDYTLTLTFDDGTSYTTPSIRGATGSSGKDGSNGKDGTSVTHSWSGTTLSVTSASGTSSANLKGEKGDKGDKGDSIKGDKGDTGAAGTSVTVKSVSESTADGGSNVVTFSDGKTVTIKNGSKGSAGATGATGAAGKTPVKGVDYFTAADQESIVQQVIAALGTPVFGRVDADNNIILTGELADGNIYTLKYEDAEGNVTEIGTLTQGLNYTNQIPISIDTDGSIYNGKGYMEARRISSSGSVSTMTNTSATNPAFLTGLIPVKAGDVVRMKNCFIDTNDGDNSAVYGIAGYSMRIAYYDKDRAWKNANTWVQVGAADCKFVTATPDSRGHVTELTITSTFTSSAYTYIRLGLAPDKDNGFTPADAIVTVNEPIV